MSHRPRIAVFISGGGSNLQSLIDASRDGRLKADIVLVVSSKLKAFGLQRAAKADIDTFVFRLKDYPDPEAAETDLIEKLDAYDIDYIALAGYLKLLPASVVKKYRNCIINIHPALLPKYGGQGMYGHFVHEAVIASGDKVSGPTVHIVDEIYDNGRILMQEEVPVMPDDTSETLAARVLEAEHRIYPQALQKLIEEQQVRSRGS